MVRQENQSGVWRRFGIKLQSLLIRTCGFLASSDESDTRETGMKRGVGGVMGFGKYFGGDHGARLRALIDE